MKARALAALLGGAGLVMAFAPNAGATAAGSSGTLTPSGATAAGPCGTTTTPPATVKHVIWIFMENNSYNTIVGNSSAPYINSLMTSCGSADNYHNITHHSLANYMGATYGAKLSALLKFDNDCFPSSTCDVTTTNLFRQTAGHGGWKAFDESMPSNCYTQNSGFYAPRHNPAVYYTDLASQCATDDQVLGTTTSSPLLTDLKKQGTTPAFTFVTPNLCDDMHGEPGCPSNLIQTGDTWLSQWVPLITGSPVYQSGNTVLFITWDEGGGGTTGESCATNTTDESCQVLLLAVAPSVVPGSVDSALTNHYSLLKTTEDLLGLTELGLAKTATSLAPAFNL